MTVYIEYAFLQNFVFDGALLSLSFYVAKSPFSWKRILFSALFGAVFALVFPLLRLPNFLLLLLKILVGCLLCLLAFGAVNTKKEWGRYAFTVGLFFACSFGFGGALLALTQGFFTEKVPFWLVFVGFTALGILTVALVGKFYEKQTVNASLYTCELTYKAKKLRLDGFFDSGNLAMKNGLPVCFVSPDVIYELFGEDILEGCGQVCDEMQIQTLVGVKTLPLYKATLTVLDGVKKERKDVYFAPSTNMIAREYKLLLNGSIFKERSWV